MKSVLFLFFLFIFISCKDDSNPTSPANTSPQFDYTEGFPNVFGDYTAITNEFYASCSDGSSGSSPAITMQLAVVQDKEKIICYGRDTTIQNDTSIVLLETTDLEGILKKDATFLLERSAEFRSSTLGLLDVDYTFSGEFTPVGWSGTYKYRLYIESLNATCTYTTNYSGDKLGKINKKSNKHHNFEDILLRRIISSWNVNAN